MLFTSYTFLFVFLPVTLVVMFWIANWGGTRAAGLWLTAASLFFYAWWNPRYLVLIIVSIVANYWFGVGINYTRNNRICLSPKAMLALGVAFNLGILGYYKYANFFVLTCHSVFGSNWSIQPIFLPLAISFFTFTQIAYLLDAYHGLTEAYDFLYYALFVSFFPHLIAGPIVSYRRLMPQFAKAATYRFNAENVAEGLSVFAIGLSKKMLLADNIAPLTKIGFDLDSPPSFIWAWIAALAYTFQLYFDFSGYSDMAIGLGRIFNVRFPLNFDSPYKALDISDFWRRWHITLSHFLRDHLYIPLGGNRHGEPKRYLNIMVTMLLGGLWHGASWTFVIWGGLHGIYLAIHHLFQRSMRGVAWVSMRWMGFLWQGVTFTAVVIGWVFFRAHSVVQALSLLGTMFGTEHWMAFLHPALQIGVSEAKPMEHPLPFIAHLMHSPDLNHLEVMIAAALIAFFAPNAHEIFCIAESFHEPDEPGRRPIWTLSGKWAFTIAVLLTACLLNMSNPSEFLYFKF